MSEEYILCPQCKAENIKSAVYCIECLFQLKENTASRLEYSNSKSSDEEEKIALRLNHKEQNSFYRKEKRAAAPERFKIIKSFADDAVLRSDLKFSIQEAIIESLSEFLRLEIAYGQVVDLEEYGIVGKIGYKIIVKNNKYLNRARNYLDCAITLKPLMDDEVFCYLVDVNVNEKFCIIESPTYIEKKIHGGELIIDPSMFYKALQSALDQHNNEGNDDSQEIFINQCNNLIVGSREYYNQNLNDSQNSAISYSLGSKLSIIWGPPGTGKTKTASFLANELVKMGKRVLVVSHSNNAVDVITEQICKNRILLGLYQEGDVARLCRTPNKRLIVKYPELFSWKTEIYNLQKQVEKIEKDLKENKYLSFFLEETKKRKIELEKSIEKLRKETIGNQKIVCATLTYFFMSQELKDIDFDAIIIDEASMVPVAHAYYASLKFRENLIIVGDFLQIPPICDTKSEFVFHWFGNNIYDYLGIREASAINNKPFIHLLDTQYRMHPNIAMISNSLFYDDLLKNGENVLKMNGGAHFISTEHKDSFCKSERRGIRGSSRSNQYSGKIAVEIAQRMIREIGIESVIIITPYNNQRIFIKNQLKQLKIDGVMVSTIHKSQGDEADCVIFDSVIASNCRSARSIDDNNKNLLNVAITRAKKVLFVLGDKSTIKNIGGCKFFYEIMNLISSNNKNKL